MIPLVADTGPLNYLGQIGQVELIPKIFGKVIVSQSVLDELCHPGAPEIIRGFGLLAKEQNAILLMDEAEGRKEASIRGIHCTY